jgi:hypothetical protein
MALGTHRSPDVSNPQTHDAIDRVVDAGIMTSCDGVNFCPQTPLGRQWAALNYDRLLGLDGDPRPFTPTFRDVNIETGGSTAPITVDSTVRVDNLNADRLDGFGANELVRAARGFGGPVDDFDVCGDGSILGTLQVNAPVAGILLIWSTTPWVWDNDSSALSTTLLSTEVAVDGAQVSLVIEDTTSADSFGINSQSGAVPVAAGPHTVTVRGRECGSGLAFVQVLQLTTLFVPFDNDGGQGALSGR